MSQRLPIGETLDGKRFTLPADVSTQTTAVLGIRESGKTNTAGVLCEELLRRKQQVVIVDPTNAWWGLKSSADGKSKGFPIVILGGPRGDLPLEEGDGETLADFVVESRASVVLRYLIHAGPDRSVTKAEVSEMVGIKQGGYFSTALKRLEDWGAMEVRGQLVVVSRLLYPEGVN